VVPLKGGTIHCEKCPKVSEDNPLKSSGVRECLYGGARKCVQDVPVLGKTGSNRRGRSIGKLAVNKGGG